jgi:hypothetical protein
LTENLQIVSSSADDNADSIGPENEFGPCVFPSSVSKRCRRSNSFIYKRQTSLATVMVFCMQSLVVLSEFLKNKYFFNEKSPSYILISEKDEFVKGKSPCFARILEK